MKLAMFKMRSGEGNRPRLGAVLSTGKILALSEAASLAGLTDLNIRLFESLDKMLSEWSMSLEIAGNLIETASAKGARSGDLGGAVYEMDQVVLCPPLSSPGKIICPGMNFAEHITEDKGEVAEKPAIPVAFSKFPSVIIGPDAPLSLPTGVGQIDYEVEVAAVIAEEIKGVGRSGALSHVAGYTILNDISARGIQAEEMNMGLLLMGKNFDGFAPMGPWLVTSDEIPDPQDLDMELWIEGEKEPRQKSNTSRMIYGFAELIAYWSQSTLHPGDVISSGTPSGVAAYHKPDPGPWYLRPGQVMTAKVEMLGELRTPISSLTC